MESESQNREVQSRTEQNTEQSNRIQKDFTPFQTGECIHSSFHLVHYNQLHPSPHLTAANLFHLPSSDSPNFQDLNYLTI